MYNLSVSRCIAMNRLRALLKTGRWVLRGFSEYAIANRPNTAWYCPHGRKTYYVATEIPRG